MSVCLLLISDGRYEYLGRTLESAGAMLPPPDRFVHVADPHHELGFAGAIQEGWRRALATGCGHVFHLEGDFTFNRPVDLEAMGRVLDHHPHLAQLALRRQPWNDQEQAAGGIVEMRPGDYLDCEWGRHRWLEHTVNFTTNPSLYRREICELGWPDGPESEGHFGIGLIQARPDTRFGYWGARDSGEWVEHIGRERIGVGY